MKRCDWTYQEPDYGAVARLATELGLSPAAAEVLVARGIRSAEAARQMLGCGLADLKSPWELPEIEEAVARVAGALASGEKILVYGDYDVDGVTGTAMLTGFLRRLGGQAGYYIPDRFDEGYGLHAEALSRAREEGYSLVVTVDCGLTALAEAEVARQLGMDLIITDHHRRPEVLPQARATVYDPAYLLAGAGVAYKLVTALAWTLDNPALAEEYLELAALATLADAVPLLGDNRILVRHGLPALAATSRVGLKALFEVSGLQEKEMTVSRVLFQLAPRLNAAGRLQHADQAVELLLAESVQAAWEIAGSLDQLNRQRQVIEGRMLQEAKLRAQEAVASGHRIIVLSSPLWHEGVVGLVAGRLARAHSRPAILLVERDGTCRGSGRSLPGVDLYQALHDNQELLLGYGGHAMACGLSVASDHLPALVAALNRWAEARPSDSAALPTLPVAAELLWPQLNWQLLNEIDSLQPFGEGNPEPVFVLRNLPVARVRRVGSEGEHLKLTLQSEGQPLSAIGFSLGEMAAGLNPGMTVDVAASLQHDHWDGQDSLQLRLLDINVVTSLAGDNLDESIGFSAADVLAALAGNQVVLGLHGAAAAAIRGKFLQQAIARDGRAVLLCPSRRQVWQRYQQYRARLPCLVGDGSRSHRQSLLILDRFARDGGLLIATPSFWEHHLGGRPAAVTYVDGMGEEDFGLAMLDRLLGQGGPTVVAPEPHLMPAASARASRWPVRVMGYERADGKLDLVTGQSPPLADIVSSGPTLVITGSLKQTRKVVAGLQASGPDIATRVLELNRPLWYTYQDKIVRQFNQGVWQTIASPASLAEELDGLKARQVVFLASPFSHAEFIRQVAALAGETASVYFPDSQASLRHNWEVLEKMCPDRDAIRRFYLALIQRPDGDKMISGQMPYTWRAISAVLEEVGLIALVAGRYRLTGRRERVDLASSWRHNEAQREWHWLQKWQGELNLPHGIVV